MTKLMILAALTAASLGQPALAQIASANPAVAVPYRDLDLRTEAGTKSLDRRILRAVIEVCGSASDFDLKGKNDVRQCRRDTMRVASAQADLVIAGATRSESVRVAAARN